MLLHLLLLLTTPLLGMPPLLLPPPLMLLSPLMAQTQMAQLNRFMFMRKLQMLRKRENERSSHLQWVNTQISNDVQKAVKGHVPLMGALIKSFKGGCALSMVRRPNDAG
jgi:hypothetical protein